MVIQLSGTAVPGRYQTEPEAEEERFRICQMRIAALRGDWNPSGVFADLVDNSGNLTGCN